MTDPARPKVLYLVHRVPCPPDKGDRIRNFHVLRFLARRAAVHLACLADEDVSDESLRTLRRYCERVAIVPVGRFRWVRALSSFARGQTITAGAFNSPALRSTVAAWVRETGYCAAVASGSSMVPYLRLPELRDTPAVVDLVDVDSQKWFDYSASRRWPRSWLYRSEGRQLRRLEQSLPTWARAVTLVSDAEAALYRQFCPADNVHAVTNGVDQVYFCPGDPREPADGCVFVGALDYYPNVDAVSWFCREIWPEIYRRRPTRLVLVGRRPGQAVLRLAEIPGVEVAGEVPDVRPYLRRAAVAVAPLRLARGLQNKVLEALATGTAVVASPAALAALRVRPGIELLTAHSPADWVDVVLSALNDVPLRRRLGTAGRAYVEEHHSWERCLQPLAGLLGLPGNPSVVAAPVPAGSER